MVIRLIPFAAHDPSSRPVAGVFVGRGVYKSTDRIHLGDPVWSLVGMSKRTSPTYTTMNWPAYNEAPKQRGPPTVWFDSEISWNAAPPGKRGRRQSYSDSVIQTCLTMKVLFGMALRQTIGFVESLSRLVGLGLSPTSARCLVARKLWR